eukprot:gene15146-16703_t
MSASHSMVDVRIQRESARDTLLDLILKKYNQASRDSIRGPVATKSDLKAFRIGAANSRKEQKDYRYKKEPDSNKLRDTILDGNTVGCFSYGGEKRLCFTELVQNVLKDYNVHEIFSRRDELLIFCSKCTPQQLDSLKLAGILPWTSTSSNLISKSDAYRLWGSLYGSRAPKVDPKIRMRNTLNFEVYHECFGGCVGLFEPELYTEPTSQCIRCTECNGLFSTKKFVSHNHTSFDEVHTCHWGFESSRWRAYLMLVEQKPTRELIFLWDSIKSKFNSNRSKKTTPVDGAEDPDFVAFIKSPERKKTTFSPIETLRIDREARLSSSDTDSSDGGRPPSANEFKDVSRQSAFHPWSPTNNKSLSTQQRVDIENSSQSRFIFPSSASKDSHMSATPKPASHSFPSRVSYQPTSNLAVVHAQCGCPAPGPLGASPMYLSCQQCKNAAASASCTGLQLLAQKASERPGEIDNAGLEAGGQGSCQSGCELCQNQRSHNTTDGLESMVENILRKYMSSEVKQPNISDVSHLLASELKRLHLTEEEKIRELSLQNQRLQTELHLMKINCDKKYSESMETKRRVEQELEVVQREHQKDIARFNRITWEFQQEVNRHKMGNENADTKETIEALKKEGIILNAQLEQSQIEKENLRKQLQSLWHGGSSFGSGASRPSSSHHHHHYQQQQQQQQQQRSMNSSMDVDYPPAHSIVRHFPLHLKRESEEPMENCGGSKAQSSSTLAPIEQHRSSSSSAVVTNEKPNVIKFTEDSKKGIVDILESSEESDIEIET